MSIWKKQVTLDTLNSPEPRTIHHSLGIQFTTIGPDFLEATMPVDERTHQPAGILHGGASVVLAESLGSVASLLASGSERKCVGIEINASHLRAVRKGTVKGRATPIRLGQSLHVWDIRIFENEQPNAAQICQCRLTVMILAEK